VSRCYQFIIISRDEEDALRSPTISISIRWTGTKKKSLEVSEQKAEPRRKKKL
jgi:hypothetical protein